MPMGSDPALDQPDQKVMGQDHPRNMPMLRSAYEMLGIKFTAHIKVNREPFENFWYHISNELDVSDRGIFFIF